MFDTRKKLMFKYICLKWEKCYKWNKKQIKVSCRLVFRNALKLLSNIFWVEHKTFLFYKMSMLLSYTLECDDGKFGTDCRIVCGHCHQGQPCDKETGACLHGCEPGYDGIYCNKCKYMIALILFCVFLFKYS